MSTRVTTTTAFGKPWSTEEAFLQSDCSPSELAGPGVRESYKKEIFIREERDGIACAVVNQL